MQQLIRLERGYGITRLQLYVFKFAEVRKNHLRHGNLTPGTAQTRSLKDTFIA